ncbi:hypothetical protein SBI67_07670 [Mycolicibacterium sp. 120266]|uniref:hypothetical protein n=1 Tax=Mycolicibacterium sp. 120266 TaxID=3090601 RepID=UPI00299D28DA|nr:hypothetical protein [Mycolicibacterium sp. 120266]MDX1871992.1 hypothetical protein [Mycolicibacterium sp. 120266]
MGTDAASGAVGAEPLNLEVSVIPFICPTCGHIDIDAAECGSCPDGDNRLG